ncbi:MAG TPA: leucyl/phenylalanyl-tRNA--protein transferase [Ilumatobacter sp.]|nr:leucyl/phenylalanyl-tRNA--protein transferase [Ilumatobacter sp.]
MSERPTRPQSPARLANVVPHIAPIEPPPSRWSMPTTPPLDDSDIVAIGADLEPGTLLSAYRVGLFPMPFDRRRIAWFSPDPRGILPVDGLHISRTLQRHLSRFSITVDTAFTDVMHGCAYPPRSGAWINGEFIDAYTTLHQLGWAHSVEVRDASSGELVGGLYGVRIGRFFAGESMFHRRTDASKAAMVGLVEWLLQTGATLLDVQWTTPHLTSMGAIDVSRHDYIERLAAAVS